MSLPAPTPARRASSRKGGRGGALRVQAAPSLDAIDTAAWDGLACDLPMKRGLLRAFDETATTRSIFAVVSDDDGPYAAVAARPVAQTGLLRRVLQVGPPTTRRHALQLRAGTALDDALPRLVPHLARLARRAGCIALCACTEASERDVFERHGFVTLEMPPSTRTDLTRFADQAALVAALPRRGHEANRARRRAEQAGVRFERTCPPRTSLRPLAELVRATYANHGEALTFSDELFPRLFASDFGTQALFTAHVGERLATAVWCTFDGQVVTASLAAVDQELARPSYAYFATIEHIVRWAFELGARAIEWGVSNEAIKQRYGAADLVDLVAAVRPAFPLPAPLWSGLQALLRRGDVRRALGIAPPEARPSPPDA